MNLERSWSSTSSSSDAGTISAFQLPLLRFSFEDNGEIDRGSKGKEKEGTWTDDERTLLMYARESEKRMEEYNGKWEELCHKYELKEVPHRLRFENDTDKRIVKHESTASTSTASTSSTSASSSSSSSSEQSIPLSPSTVDTNITVPEVKELPIVPPYALARKFQIMSDCDDRDGRLYPTGTVPPYQSYGTTTLNPAEAMCVICGSHIEGRIISVPCGHQFDANCLLDMFLLNVNDESVFPPRCCGQTISHTLVERYLHEDLIDLFNAKIKEVQTPHRLYCSNVRCSHFLGPRESRAKAIQCPSCMQKTCASCRQPEHPEENCKPDELVTKTLVLGQSHGWQRCPTCRTLVERNMGCSHITCRCGSHWCYGCGRNLGACECHVHVAVPRRIVRWVFRTRRRVGVRQDTNYLLASEAEYVGAIEPIKPALVRMFSEPWKNFSKAIHIRASG